MTSQFQSRIFQHLQSSWVEGCGKCWEPSLEARNANFRRHRATLNHKMAEKKKRSPKPSTAICYRCLQCLVAAILSHPQRIHGRFFGDVFAAYHILRAWHVGLVTLRLFQVENARDIAHVSWYFQGFFAWSWFDSHGQWHYISNTSPLLP